MLRVIPAPVVTMTVTPATATLVMGKTLQLSAVPKDAEGNALGNRTITWTSSAPALATVSEAGLVTAKSTGVVTVTATSEGKSGTAELTLVIPVKTVTVTAAENRTSLLPGQTVQLSAVAKDSLGTTLNREILWSSSNGLVATVSTTGLVTPTGNGTATILATSEGVTGTIVITAAGGSGGTSSGGTIAAIATLPTALAVVSGDTASVAFRPTDASGAVVTQTSGATFVTGPVTVSQTQVTSGTLSCGTSGICTQRLSTQGVTAGAPAVAVPLRIVPTNGGAEGSVTVVVVGTVADSLVGSFVPASSVAVPSVAVGDTVTIRATLFYAGGSALASNARFTQLTGAANLAPCTVGWETGQVSGGCVKVVPTAAGAVKVIASLPKLGGGSSWADTLEVTAGTAQVAAITVTPATVTVGVGQSSTLAATLKDDFNNTLTGRIVTWSTSDPAIATVSATGVVTGVKPGATTVLAQSGSKIGTATVTVVSAFNLRDQGLTVSGSNGWDGDFTCALDEAGAAWCWGNNLAGQLGDGTTVSRTQPTKVVGDVRFTNITATDGTTCGLAMEGDIYCWGGGWGQLGNGTNSSSSIPVRVTTTEKFRSVSAGHNHVCAVTSDDEAYCWGSGFEGQLGTGDWGQGAQKNVPTKIALSAKVQSLSAMAQGGCVLTSARETFCWGQGYAGQIGNGVTNANQPTPQKVLGGYEFEALAGGGHTMCGQLPVGTIYCWGANHFQQLGGGGGSFAVPQAVLFGGVQLRSLGIGFDHICGMTADGSAYCSGSNDWGKLGFASPDQASTPLPVALGGPVSVIIAGYNHTCAVLRAGGAKCWGSNDVGQLGSGSQTSTQTPTAIKGDKQFASLAPGASVHSACGLDAAGKAFCWGMWAWNFSESPGLQTRLKPVETAGLFTFSSLSRGDQHTCGLRSNGEAWCWGAGWSGQRGDGTNNSTASPSRVNATESFTRISTGNQHTCAVTAGGAAYCWGANWSGQIGDGTRGADRLSPVRVPGVTLSSISAGNEHSCGLAADGTAYCWGNNLSGQLGDGTQTQRLSPTLVALNLKFSKIFAGQSRTCGIAVAPAGKLYCWGEGGNGQLGIGANSSVSTPTAVNSALTFSSVASGWDFTCGLTTTGQTHCWGTGRYGTLGTSVSTTTSQNSPVRVAGDPGFVSLAAGNQHVCGVTAAKVTHCWGRNRVGSLTADVIAPIAVTGSTVFRGSR